MHPLGAALVERRWTVTVPDLRSHLATPAAFAAAAIEALPHADVVIGHSGAGAMLPLIADRVGATATLFIDAVLPGDGAEFTPSKAFIELLSRIPTADGLLAPWHQWWPDGTMARLVPDAPLRHLLEAEVPRVHRAFYDHVIGLPLQWWERPATYLQLSAGYDDERSRAEHWGWPIATLDGNHLDLVTKPDLVATSVLALVDRALRFEPEGGSS